MLLVGGVIPVLHKVKTVSPKLGVIWWTLLDLNWLCIIYLYYFLVCAYLACAFVTYLNFYYTHIITCQSVQQYIRVWKWRRRFCDLLGNKNLLVSMSISWLGVLRSPVEYFDSFFYSLLRYAWINVLLF